MGWFCSHRTFAVIRSTMKYLFMCKTLIDSKLKTWHPAALVASPWIQRWFSVFLFPKTTVSLLLLRVFLICDRARLRVLIPYSTSGEILNMFMHFSCDILTLFKRRWWQKRATWLFFSSLHQEQKVFWQLSPLSPFPDMKTVIGEVTLLNNVNYSIFFKW